MAQNPWDAFPVAPSAGPLPAPPPDPMKVEDQQFQRAAAVRADRAEERADRTEARAVAKDAKEAADPKSTEYQAKSASFLGRMLEAEKAYGAVPPDSRDARTAVGQSFHDAAPGVENYFNTPDRQKSDQAARNFIAATLRQESGAAISPEEYRNQYRIFFPMPGDGQAVIDQKAEARRQAIAGFRIAAGPLADRAAATVGAERTVRSGRTGKEYTFTVPDGADEAAILAAAKSAILSAEPQTTENPVLEPPPSGGGGQAPAAEPTADYSLSGIGRGLAMGVGDIVQGVGNVAGIVANPLNATINAATGSNLSTDVGRSLRDITGLPDNPHTTTSAITKGGVSAMFGAGLARGAGALLEPGVAKGALNVIGRNPLADTFAGSSGGGAAEETRKAGYGVPAQIGAAVLAGAPAYGVAGMMGAARSPKVASPVMQAADRQGITMLPADVGGAGTRMASGAVGRTLGGVPMAEAADASIASAGAARDRVAAGVGRVADDTGAGQAAQRGAKSFVSASEARGGELFERIPVPAKQDAVTTSTRAALAEVTQGLRSNPKLSKLWTGNPRLKATLDALTPEDTRQAGQVQHAAASDKVRGAETALQAARADAENTLHFERSQARDAVEKAHSAYDDILASARKDVTDAQKQYDAFRDQITPPGQQVKAQQAIDAANKRLTALRNKDAAVPEVGAALKEIKDAEAGLTSLRFSEPKSDAMTAAQDALASAKSEQDAAFVASRQPPQGGKISWEDMKRLRTIVGQMIGQPGLTADGASLDAMRKFYGALSSDMEATAAATSPRALSEFKRANQFWRGRQDRIDNVLSGVLGNDLNKGEAAAFEQINRWAQAKGGDFNRLARTIRSMPADDADSIRATIIGRMGQAKAGAQNADGSQFSPATFATQWNGLSNRAKSVLFPNAAHRANLDDIALAASGMKRAGEFSNFSNTSLGTNLTAHGIGAVTAPLTTAVLAASEFGLGKLLSSPKFARWLAKVPAGDNPRAIKSYVDRLSTIAVEDAAIAGDAKALQQHLQQTFGQSPAHRAAAEDEHKDVRREPPRR